MRGLVRTLLVLSAAAIAVSVFAAPVPVVDLAAAAGPHAGGKTVELICRRGWRASAVGQYGGVTFGVSCNNGRGRTRIDAVANTAYSVRMGVESASTALDCFFTGDSQVVNQTCGAVRLSIR